MKHIRTYENVKLYKDKIKMLIPESYIVFLYKSYSYITYEYHSYLILGKIKSLPYIEDNNTFIKIYITNYISNDPNKISSTRTFNVDMMEPIVQKNSLKEIEKDFEKYEEIWKIKNTSDKYNL